MAETPSNDARDAGDAEITPNRIDELIERISLWHKQAHAKELPHHVQYPKSALSTSGAKPSPRGARGLYGPEPAGSLALAVLEELALGPRRPLPQLLAPLVVDPAAAWHALALTGVDVAWRVFPRAEAADPVGAGEMLAEWVLLVLQRAARRPSSGLNGPGGCAAQAMLVALVRDRVPDPLGVVDIRGLLAGLLEGHVAMLAETDPEQRRQIIAGMREAHARYPGSRA